MKVNKYIFLTIFTAAAVFIVKPVFAQNTHQSDYDFQIDQYRRNYSEYQVFLSDFIDHPTLNNEQKALLSAKRSLVSRELMVANFYLILSDKITSNKVDFPIINQSLADLRTISQYHFSQAELADQIVSKDDLSKFTSNYLDQVGRQRSKVAQAQVANKIAELLALQQETIRAQNALMPALSDKLNNVNVSNGLNQLQNFQNEITNKINSLADTTSKLTIGEQSEEQLYTDSSQALSDIQTTLNKLINVIIELDTNYANH